MLMSAAFCATLGVLVKSRAFHPATLRLGPERDVGMDLRDVIAAMGAFLVGGLLQSLLVVAWVGLGDDGDLEAAFAALPPAELAALNLVGQIAMWTPGVGYLLWRLHHGGHLRLGGVVPRRPGRDLGVALVATWVAFILTWGVGLVITLVVVLSGGEIPDHGHEVLKKMVESDSWVVIALLTVSAVVIAPIAEEFFFRGLLQTAMQSVIGHHKRWHSILPVAVLFGMIHYGSVPWFMLPVLMLLGVVFGWVYERTGSLWCAVGVHAGYNATSTVLSLLAS